CRPSTSLPSRGAIACPTAAPPARRARTAGVAPSGSSPLIPRSRRESKSNFRCPIELPVTGACTSATRPASTTQATVVLAQSISLLSCTCSLLLAPRSLLRCTLIVGVSTARNSAALTLLQRGLALSHVRRALPLRAAPPRHRRALLRVLTLPNPSYRPGLATPYPRLYPIAHLPSASRTLPRRAHTCDQPRFEP
ncbi:hypothetical protein FB451DRAFT_1486782, partial [Mycena latifolia]